jgi:hypothetical protein
VYASNSVNPTSSEPQKEDSDVDITKNEEKGDEKRYTEPKVYQVDEMIQKAMRDEQGNINGHFTKSDFAFVAFVRPNERWTEDEIEQTLEQLLREGKIVELEGGRYEPVESLRSEDE